MFAFKLSHYKKFMISICHVFVHLHWFMLTLSHKRTTAFRYYRNSCIEGKKRTEIEDLEQASRSDLDLDFLSRETSAVVTMSHAMTKPTKWLCAQRRLRSAWASAQSDQASLSSCRKLGSLATLERTAKTLISLPG